MKCKQFLINLLDLLYLKDKVNGDIVDDTKSNHKHPSNGTSANNTIKITLNPLADAEHTEVNCIANQTYFSIFWLARH